MSLIRATFAAIATVTLVASLGFVGAVPAYADEPHVTPLDPLTYDDLDALIQSYAPSGASAQTVDPTAAARCGAPAPDPVPDGQPIVFTIGSAAPITVGQISAATWRKPPVADPTWQQNFQGLMWMRELARRAAEDDQQQSLAALVAQSAEFHTDNPDTGASTYGWDEATATRRLEAQNCLYDLTGSAALIPGMVANAAVILGPRYYGPPVHPVHNHGLMTNLQLVRAAELLNMPAWKAIAIRRMTSEAPQAFSKLGFSYEQSSNYQAVNASLWGQAVRVLGESASTTGAGTQLDKAVTAAWRAYSWLTEPDGKIVQIGDSDESVGLASGLTTPRVLRDDQTGYIIGRWSWTDPLTTYYTVRYGPPRRAHGQEDRAGGVTWTTKGVRVLVGPGRFNYDKASSWSIYMTGPRSHNVAIPDHGAVRSGKSAVVAALVQAAAHAWTISDSVYNTPHTRGVNISRDARRMQVSDSFPSVSLWRQHWHLDPAWALTSGTVGGTQLTFTHSAGQKLTVTTTGRISGIVRGETNPIQGWHFAAFGSRSPAYEIIIRSYGRACLTTFTVT